MDYKARLWLIARSHGEIAADGMAYLYDTNSEFNQSVRQIIDQHEDPIQASQEIVILLIKLLSKYQALAFNVTKSGDGEKC